jgi:hypothetical protein
MSSGGEMNRAYSRIAALMLGGFLLAGSVQPVLAYDRCERRIRNAEMKLDRAIRRHGPHSRQAERQREHLERVRATCHR